MADHVLQSKPKNYGAIPKVISIPHKNIWPCSAEQTDSAELAELTYSMKMYLNLNQGIMERFQSY